MRRAALPPAAAERVERALELLAHGWREDQYERAFVDAIATAVPSAFAAQLGWTAEQPMRQRTVATTDESTRIEDTPWCEACLGKTTYSPMTRDPFANRAVRIPEISWQNPAGLLVFRDLYMRPLGLEDQVRATVYYRDTFIAFFGIMRERNAPKFSQDDVNAFDVVLARIRDLLLLRRDLQQGPLAPALVLELLDAIEAPAFVLAGGVVVHANVSARSRLHGRAPAWLHGDRMPAGVRRIPFCVGERTFTIVIADCLSWEPDTASQARWARALRLPPSLARVAALAADGAADKEIAARLDMPLATVRTYIRRLYARLGVTSRRELRRLITVAGAT